MTCRNSYESVLDDESGYDHILLTDDSRTFFGIQWVDGISPITLYHLAGRFHRTFTIILVLWQQISFDL